MYTLTPHVIIALSSVSATACVSRDRSVWPPASPATGKQLLDSPMSILTDTPDIEAVDIEDDQMVHGALRSTWPRRTAAWSAHELE